MKNSKFIILIIIVVSLISACNKPASKEKVYSVSGENDEFIINNGSITITDGMDEFIGGDLSFKNAEMLDVNEYALAFFYNKDGKIIEIVTNSSIVEGEEIDTELLTISGKKLIDNQDLELIKDTLTFSLSGKLMNGEDFDYQLTLDVERED